MKTKVLISVFLLIGNGFLAAATNDTTAVLKRGLFEEEANHNLDAAIQAYQSVITQFDQDRKVAATAIFRLGECYRRQGNTNSATAQYERILREFSDQTPLVALSQDNLSGFGGAIPSSAGSNVAGRTEQKRLLEEEVKLVEKKLDAQQRQFKTGYANQDSLWSTQRELLELKRQIAALNAGAPVTVSGAEASSSAPTTAEAEEVKRIQAMIKDSPDLINAKDNNGATPLHRAASNGQVIVATFLLQNGADIEAKDTVGETALYDAALNGHKSLVELLLQNRANVRSATWRGETPLHAAAGKGFRSIVELLLDRGAEVNASTTAGTTPLHMAVAKDFKAVADFLLSHGADVNAVTEDVLDSTNQRFYGTPLHLAAQVGDAEMAAALLDRKADMNTLDKNDQTALDVCAAKGNIAVAKLLLSRGAGVDVPNSQGWTALCYAVRAKGFETVAFLLTNGANPNVKFELTDKSGGRSDMTQIKKGYTPLLLAFQYSSFEIADLLLANKADPNIRSDPGATLIFMALSVQNAGFRKRWLPALVQGGADINARDPVGCTPLMRAAEDGDKEIVDLLLAHKADVNAKDKNGLSPLHYAAQSCRVGSANANAIANALLAAGANVNLQANDGSTPLNAALAPTSALYRTQGQFADLLRVHGAAEFLPNPGRIEIRRGQSYSSVVFSQSTNDWNQFTLFEVLAAHLDLLGTSPEGEQPTQVRSDLLTVNGLYGPGRSLANPDFSHVRIRQPAQNQKGWQDTIIDVAAALKSGDCSRNVPLQWGDVVEIPQTDRPRNDDWRGFSRAELATLNKCVGRRIEIIIRGQSTKLTLGPEVDEIGNVVTRVPFWLKPVLYRSNLMTMERLTREGGLDLSRVKVTRQDSVTGKKEEWVIDCSQFKPPPDFWLRDGDVVEIPDKQ